MQNVAPQRERWERTTGIMKNTYNLSLVRRRIQEVLPGPLTAIGESALEAFLAVPGVSAWRPARFGLKELSYVFDIGLPIALIGENPSVRTHRLRAGEAVRDGRYPERCLWSEVHTAAILRAWGADVCFAGETTTAAACLEVRLQNGETLEVRVLGATPEAETERLRTHLIAVDERAIPHGYENAVARLERDGPGDANVAAVIGLEPRFWIGLQQKEWLYRVRLNSGASVNMPSAILGKPDGNRHSMRFPLLT